MRPARLHSPTELHGFGVCRDPGSLAYPVRNEMTGVWSHDTSGPLTGLPSRTAASDACHALVPRRRVA
ncbi:hypothetical protein ACWC5I_20480 [Kitasatospora sp. NPDC001574]